MDRTLTQSHGRRLRFPPAQLELDAQTAQSLIHFFDKSRIETRHRPYVLLASVGSQAAPTGSRLRMSETTFKTRRLTDTLPIPCLPSGHWKELVFSGSACDPDCVATLVSHRSEALYTNVRSVQISDRRTITTVRDRWRETRTSACAYWTMFNNIITELEAPELRKSGENGPIDSYC